MVFRCAFYFRKEWNIPVVELKISLAIVIASAKQYTFDYYYFFYNKCTFQDRKKMYISSAWRSALKLAPISVIYYMWHCWTNRVGQFGTKGSQRARKTIRRSCPECTSLICECKIYVLLYFLRRVKYKIFSFVLQTPKFLKRLYYV